MVNEHCACVNTYLVKCIYDGAKEKSKFHKHRAKRFLMFEVLKN